MGGQFRCYRMYCGWMDGGEKMVAAVAGERAGAVAGGGGFVVEVPTPPELGSYDGHT